jgi:hypothetical protein
MIFKRKHKKTAAQPVFRNTLRSPAVEPPEPTPAPAQVKEKKETPRQNYVPGLGVMQSLLDGSILTRDSFMRALPFGIFLGFIGLIYIANSYYAIRQIRKIDSITNEMKEYQYEYITTKSSLMFHAKPSELARKLEATGIKESVKPPEKIFVNE